MTYRTPADEAYSPPSWTWRVRVVSLIVYSIGLVLFALVPLLPPPNPLEWVEAVIAFIAGLATIGLTLRLAFPHWRLGRWAYLQSAAAGVLTFLAFNIGVDSVSVGFRSVFGFFLWAGILAALGSHIEYGGKPSIRESLYEHTEGRDA